MLELPLIIGAFIAGFLMFLAPCTLPIIPAYIAFIGGVSSGEQKTDVERRVARRKILRNAFAFTIGFSLVFIVLGASAAGVGALLGPWRDVLARAGGLLIILFGLTMVGALRIPALLAEHRIRPPSFLTIGTVSSSLVIGAIFALGWSPCIGPILGSVLLVASNSETALYGALLLGIFSLGLAIPFLLTALLIEHATAFLSRISGFAQTLSTIGGVLLVVLGLLILFGNTAIVYAWFYHVFENSGYGGLLQYL